MNLLHIDSSITRTFSITRQLSREVVNQLTETGVFKQVTYRDLVKDEIGHLTGEIAAGFRPVPGSPSVSTEQAAEYQVSNTLIKEFLESDVIVIGAPMYNFSVSSQLKAWIDRIAQPGKTFSYTANGPVGLAGGKKVIIVSARGGSITTLLWKKWIFRSCICVTLWLSWALIGWNLSALKVHQKAKR